MENLAFKEVLQRAKKNNSLVALHNDANEPRAFAAGWIEAVTDEHVILRHISPHGRYDGFKLLYLESIFRVDGEGRYLERIATLFQARKEEFPAEFLPADLGAEPNLMVEMLAAAQRLDMVCALEIADDDEVTGWVSEIALDTATIARLDHYGSADYDATVHFGIVSALHCDSERMQALKILARWRRSDHLEPPDWLKI